MKLTVTDSVGLTDTVDVTLTFAPKLSIVTRTPRAAKVGRAVALRLTATGGVEPRTWKIVHGSLPRGVRFSTRTGAFSGTPRRAGKTRLVVQVSDKLGGTARLAITLTVKA